MIKLFLPLVFMITPAHAQFNFWHGMVSPKGKIEWLTPGISIGSSSGTLTVTPTLSYNSASVSSVLPVTKFQAQIQDCGVSPSWTPTRPVACANPTAIGSWINLSSSGLPVNYSSLVHGHYYFFKVRACNSVKCSTPSNSLTFFGNGCTSGTQSFTYRNATENWTAPSNCNKFEFHMWGGAGATPAGNTNFQLGGYAGFTQATIKSNTYYNANFQITVAQAGANPSGGGGATTVSTPAGVLAIAPGGGGASKNPSDSGWAYGGADANTTGAPSARNASCVTRFFGGRSGSGSGGINPDGCPAGGDGSFGQGGNRTSGGAFTCSQGAAAFGGGGRGCSNGTQMVGGGGGGYYGGSAGCAMSGYTQFGSPGGCSSPHTFFGGGGGGSSYCNTGATGYQFCFSYSKNITFGSYWDGIAGAPVVGGGQNGKALVIYSYEP